MLEVSFAKKKKRLLMSEKESNSTNMWESSFVSGSTSTVIPMGILGDNLGVLIITVKLDGMNYLEWS